MQAWMAAARRMVQGVIGPSPFTFNGLKEGRSTTCRMSTVGGAQHVECVVVGAGVVGLAIARALALAGREVVILDSSSSFGSETSSRNSEVIHAGLYYPLDSLKSWMCIEGNKALYDFCRQRSIPHKNTSKLVVASNKEQLVQLCALHAWAQKCGVQGLRLLSREEALSLEPNLRCQAALLSPASGILDSHAYMATLLADAEASGAVLAVASKVLRGRVLNSRSRVFMGAGGSGGGENGASEMGGHEQVGVRSSSGSSSSSGGSSGSGGSRGGSVGGTGMPAVNETQLGNRRGQSQAGGGGIILEVQDLQSKEVMALHADVVVNSAGLHAQTVSHSIDGIPPSSIPPLYLAKGNYFTLAGGSTAAATQARPAATTPTNPANSIVNEDSPSHHTSSRPQFSRLIYPMPPASGGGLGIHLTLDMGGGLRFGPDVEHVQCIDYTVDPGRAPAFEDAIRSYWPGLPSNALVPGYAGIRPKISAPGQPAADFLVQGPDQHHVQGLVCLYGIESPGLTASLVLAEHVARMLLHSSAS